MSATSKVSPGAGDIMRAATELFAARGYDAVSISAIAERAESSKANIFHHFGNKQGLYLAVMNTATERLTQEFSRLLESSDDRAAKVEQAIRASLTVLNEDENRSRLVFREVMESGPGRAETLAEDVFGKEFATLTALLADAQERGDCPCDPQPSFLAFLMLSANLMVFHCRQVIRHLPGGDFVDQEERYIKMLCDVLIERRTQERGGERE